MMGFAADLLIECLAAQGLSRDLAEKAVKVLEAARWDGKNPEPWERAAKVYHLRSKKVEVLEISIRFGLAERTVFHLLRAHLEARRKALKAAS